MKSWGFSCMRKQWIPGHFSLLPRGLGTRLVPFCLNLSLFFLSLSHFHFPSSLHPSLPSFPSFFPRSLPSLSPFLPPLLLSHFFILFLPSLPSFLAPSLPPPFHPSSSPFSSSLHTDNTNNTNGSNADSALWKRAKLLAHRVQSVCITEHLPIVPKRLVVTNVIHTLLVSLIDSVKQCDRFLNSDLSMEPEGLK